MWTSSNWKHLKEIPPPPLFHFVLFITFSLFSLSFFTTNWSLTLIAVLVLAVYKINSPVLARLNLAWHFLGLSLAWLFQPLFLIIIYWCLFFPFGWLLHMLRKKKNTGQWIERNRIVRFDKMF